MSKVEHGETLLLTVTIKGPEIRPGIKYLTTASTY